MLVAERDQHPAPTSLADAVGHDLQARDHVLRLLDLAGDEVKLGQTVALAAGGLGFLLDAVDEPVVLDAERGLIGEDLQRLDRVQVGAAPRSRLVHADQAQHPPARAVNGHQQQVLRIPGARPGAHALLQDLDDGHPGQQRLAAFDGQEITAADPVNILHQPPRLLEGRRDLAHLFEHGHRQARLGGPAQDAVALVHLADQHDVEADRLLDAVRHLFERFGQAGALAEHLAQLEHAAHPLGADAKVPVKLDLILVAAGVADGNRRLIGQRQHEIDQSLVEDIRARAVQVDQPGRLLALHDRDHQGRARFGRRGLVLVLEIIVHAHHVAAQHRRQLDRRQIGQIGFLAITAIDQRLVGQRPVFRLGEQHHARRRGARRAQGFLPDHVENMLQLDRLAERVAHAAQRVKLLEPGAQILVGGLIELHPVDHRRDLCANRQQQVHIGRGVILVAHLIGDAQLANTAILDDHRHLDRVAHPELLDQPAIGGEHALVCGQRVAHERAARDQDAVSEARPICVDVNRLVERATPDRVRRDHQIARFLVDQPHHHHVGLEQVGDGDQHRFERVFQRGHLRGDLGDGPQPFGLVRAALHLAVQAGVVDQDGGLPGENGQQPRVIFGEIGAVGLVGHLDHAEPVAAHDQRRHRHLPDADRRRQVGQVRVSDARIAPEIVAEPGIALLPQLRHRATGRGRDLVEIDALQVVHAKERHLADQQPVLVIVKQYAAQVHLHQRGDARRDLADQLNGAAHHADGLRDLLQAA